MGNISNCKRIIPFRKILIEFVYEMLITIATLPLNRVVANKFRPKTDR